MADNKFGFLQVLMREGLADEIKSTLDKRWAKFRRNPGSAFILEQFKERLKSLRD